MEFARVLETVARNLEAQSADWAVIGGLALAAHGAGRLTHDVDIVTERRVQGRLIAYLESIGYETLHRSDGYSNHAHADAALGRVDIVYVDGTTATELFGEAIESEVVPGVLARVPRVEHLIAMKVLAAKNEPSRRLQELADIAALLRSTGTDPEAVRVHFDRHDMSDGWEQIRDAI